MQNVQRYSALPAAAALLVCLSSAVAADDSWMSEAEMRAAFSGVTLEGKYGSGRPFTETYGADGRIAYRESGVSIGGKWSIEAGTFCTIYDRDPTGGCYRIRKAGGNCYEFYFVARTEADAHREPGRPSWTARGSVSGRPGACADQHSV